MTPSPPSTPTPASAPIPAPGHQSQHGLPRQAGERGGQPTAPGPGRSDEPQVDRVVSLQGVPSGAMETPQPPQDPSGGGASPAHTPPGTSLPNVRTTLSSDEILRKLDAAARRGKLAGFTPGSAASGEPGRPLFTVRDVGAPFDGEVVATHATGELAFHTRLFPRLPTIFAIVLIVSVWPGVVLMESLMNVYVPSLGKYTWWWYIPLTVVSGVPAMLGAMKKSRLALHDDALRVVESVDKALR